MKKTTLILSFLFFCVQSSGGIHLDIPNHFTTQTQSHFKDTAFYLSNISKNKMILGLGVVTTALMAYGTYRIAHIIIDRRIEDQTVDSIILALKPNFMCDESQKKKKAQTTCRRIRIMKELETVFPKGHQHRKKFEKLKTIFKYIDTLRAPNRYEKEYQNQTTFDKYMDSKIIESIKLTLKSDDQCNKHELAKKNEMDKRRKNIIKKLKEKVETNLIDALVVSPIAYILFS